MQSEIKIGNKTTGKIFIGAVEVQKIIIVRNVSKFTVSNGDTFITSDNKTFYVMGG